MAKQLSVASSDCPGTSKSTSNSSQASALPAHSPRHRRHRNFKHSVPRPTPSSGILILLASLASSASVASGSPAPLSFLCPSVGTEDNIDVPPVQRACSSAPSTSTSNVIVSKATGLPSAVAPRHVPDRFSQGPDGVWRRVGSYTLYGSTVSTCVGQSCRTPTNAVSNVDVDDQIQVGGNQSTDDANSTATPYDFQDSLPPGWKPTPKPYENKTPLILAMTLVLACIICFFIFGCLFWRRTMKKYYKSHDIEAKARKKRRANNEEVARELAAEKEVKAKQKLWARATARWKANARYSARQRRGKRGSIRSSHTNQSSYSIDGSQSQLVGLQSIVSRTSSRMASTVSIPDQLQDGVQNVLPPSSPSVITINPTPSSPQSTTPALPPAYQHQGQIPPIIVSASGTSSEEYSESPDGRARRPSHSSTYTTSAFTNDGRNADVSHQGPLHAAHLATDDKTLLAHLANLASSPPEDRDSLSAETSNAGVSAPVWDDDEIANIPLHVITASSSQPSCTPSMFPPPPSKERLAESEFYHYPFAFDEMESLEVDSEPSAPPFEENSLPQNPDLLLPSAPQLLAVDEYMSQQPSAPELDSDGVPEEHLAGQNHDRMAQPQGPSLSPYPSHRSESISSPTTESTTLPGYRP